MDQDTPQSLPDLFARVMDAPEEQRDALIDELCRGDAVRREELRRLVSAGGTETEAGDPLGEAAIAARRRELENPTPGGGAIRSGETIAGYTIERPLGEGGMGVVYLATQHKPSRRVALKLLQAWVRSDRAVRRFELEADALGRLRHPGIAQIYEAGLHNGTPYFAMEYVEGVPITEYAAARKLGTRDKLRLIAEVAAAVQHAHQQGVIHRDLKPANILVTESDAPSGGKSVPQPKVLDFGVAKLTESDVRATTLQTDVGQIIGTISYMSPEQAGGDPDAIDTRSDVYALGVIAFELLTGRLPHDVSNRLVHEAVRIIREDEPSSLSAADRSLRGDVETIIATALEKEPQRRYATPSAFASDITRYLENQPILARPASTWYQIRKFSRRNRPLVVGVAASFLILLAGLVGTSTFAVRANAARADADEARTQTVTALAAEQERAGQLQSVVEFQTEQLAGIDTMAVGVGIRSGLLARIRDPRNHASEDEAARLLAGVDFTGLALETLESTLFDRTLRSIDTQFADQPTVRARLLQSFAQSAERIGLLDLAVKQQSRAAEIRLETLGEDHPDTINSQNNLGLVLMYQGKLQESEAVLTKALERSRRLLGDTHPETIAVIENTGLLMQASGRLDDAERYLKESLDGYTAVFGEDDQRTVAAINNMGGVYEMRRDYATAETYFSRALEGSRRLLGNDDAKTLSSINNLGMVIKNQGRPEEAEPYFIEALEGRRRTLGDTHPRTIRSINNMGGLYVALGESEKARDAYTDALAQYKLAVGESHPDTVICMNNLGTVYRDLGRLDEAEALGARAVEAARTAFPPNHWIVGALLSQHANTLLTMERYELAAERCEEAYAILVATFGPDHQQATNVARIVGDIYEAWENAEPGNGHDEAMAVWRSRESGGGE